MKCLGGERRFALSEYTDRTGRNLMSIFYELNQKRIHFTFELYPKLCQRFFNSLCILVGVAGFEPTTP